MQPDPKAKSYLQSTFEESWEAQRRFASENSDLLVRAAEAISRAVKSGGKLLICGNGGSAADAQHMAAEMVGRMLVDRRPLPAIALTTDSSNLTAVGNDYGFEFVFSRQVEALGRKGDVLLAISTSGNSPNVLAAARKAKELGLTVLTLTGGSGGALKGMGDLAMNVSAGGNSSRIQESHIMAVHALVDLMDRFFL